jgi:hypothetical protein
MMNKKKEDRHYLGDKLKVTEKQNHFKRSINIISEVDQWQPPEISSSNNCKSNNFECGLTTNVSFSRFLDRERSYAVCALPYNTIPIASSFNVLLCTTASQIFQPPGPTICQPESSSPPFTIKGYLSITPAVINSPLLNRLDVLTISMNVTSFLAYFVIPYSTPEDFRYFNFICGDV